MQEFTNARIEKIFNGNYKDETGGVVDHQAGGF